ncbi:hypothetical protein [Streptomyces sp. NPDC048527]|uniref:hypothetical protein n=1 Tax=Streptomyces sp. NPDC048527 TaxID=3365568 RepID=UPI00371DECB0
MDNYNWVCVEQTDQGNVHAWAVTNPDVYGTIEVILWIGDQRHEQHSKRLIGNTLLRPGVRSGHWTTWSRA